MRYVGGKKEEGQHGGTAAGQSHSGKEGESMQGQQVSPLLSAVVTIICMSLGVVVGVLCNKEPVALPKTTNRAEFKKCLLEIRTASHNIPIRYKATESAV